ncbi:uncharacterized protein LOC114540121 [Dendronephthya gigantea]|uniref:uncharacterized protein LOC114540121 n=1 Tax=Dendronephthya gigantea TaxID=151771 RepID=UPI001069952C|nr:uncharacterized protein LOC114540121 [Dendronephthya gigantea]
MAATRNYEMLSDEQKRILSSFYNNGMISASKEMEDTITKAAEKAETTVEKVKKWIGNERKKRRKRNFEPAALEQDMSKYTKCPPIKRMASGYNMFTSNLLSSDALKGTSSNQEKMKLAASKWKDISEEERKKWNHEAQKLGKADPKTMSVEEKKKAIKRETKNLIKQVSKLKRLDYIFII